MRSLSKLDKTDYHRCNTESMSIALVGLGALGSEIARLLGLLGIGTVALVDNGLVESVNRYQNIFFRDPSNLSRSKAEVLADMGVIYFPETRWIPLVSEIADVGFEHLSRCSIIFSATDSALARVETAYAACRLDIPMVDAGLLGSAYWRGRAAWFSSGRDAACYFCQLTENRRAEILALSHSSTLSCQWTEENLEMPSTPTMSSVIAGMAIDLAFRHGLSAGKDQSFAWDISLENTPCLRAHDLSASSTCPFHQFEDKGTLISLPLDRPFRESLRALNVEAVELDWPIATHATCLKCGYEWNPMRRGAWVRRHSRCQRCGESSHFRFQMLTRIAANDASGQYSPGDLSFTAEHLYAPVYHNGRKQL